MIAKKVGSIGFLSILIGMFLVIIILMPVTIVKAQESTPPTRDGCNTCHENLYYLHDTGNWLCQCAQQMTCTCCHGGNPDVYTEDEAHAGMNLYPTRNEATACQNCHPEDYATRIEKFASLAGVSPVHPPIPTPTSQVIYSDPSFNGSPFTGSGLRSLQPWRQAGLLLLGVLLAVLAYIGVRCWRSDCLLKVQK